MEERKNIISSLKSNYGERKKGIKKRIQLLKGMNILNLMLTILCGGIIIFSIILEPLGFEVFKWQKMGLFTILSLSFTLRLPEEYFELKLLKHYYRISNKSDFDGIEKQNSELKIIIGNVNKKMGYRGILTPIAIVISILGMIQVISEGSNPYWNYTKILILLFFVIVLTRLYRVNKKLNRNIIETEKNCSEQWL